MAYDRFLIAPFNSGLVTSVKPWMIPDDAFEQLNNAYVYKGRIRKRPGSRYTGFNAATQTEIPLHSRLRINIGNTDAVTGIIAGTVPGARFEIGQQFSVGDRVFTVYQAGTPADMHSTWLLCPNATYNTTTGAYNISAGYLNTPCYWYPSDPVMGITQFKAAAADPDDPPVTYAFDMQFAFAFNNTNGYWERSGTDVWHGSDSDFFYASNWVGLEDYNPTMFVTNYNVTAVVPGPNDDPIYSFNGTTWAQFLPIKNATGCVVRGARIIAPFKERLLLFDTTEDYLIVGVPYRYKNRCRYSKIGAPFPTTTAWLEGTDAIGRQLGGYIDAPTDDEIISIAPLRDRIIVYFKHSTWELVYVYNFSQPFYWQRIDDAVGSGSLFSSVVLGRTSLTMAREGVYSCLGTSNQKIDQKVESFVEGIRLDNDGLKRVSAIRDFENELVFWSYPNFAAPLFAKTFPNNVLVYNYDNDTWGILDDSITAFGYFEQQTVQVWQLNIGIWIFQLGVWGQGSEQTNYKRIVAGNQGGFIFLIDANVAKNESVLPVTHCVVTLLPPWNPLITITVINHNLKEGDYFKLDTMGTVVLNGDGIYSVFAVLSDDSFTFFTDGPCIGLYTGGGYLGRVSRIDILSKQWNFYNNIASNVFIPKIDFCVERVAGGKITAAFLSSSSNVNLLADSAITGAQLGTNVLELSAYDLVLLEATQTRLWHPVYFQAEGENVQLRLYYSNEQMIDPAVSLSNFQLEGLVVYAKNTGNRFE